MNEYFVSGFEKIARTAGFAVVKSEGTEGYENMRHEAKAKSRENARTKAENLPVPSTTAGTSLGGTFGPDHFK